jgi:hypothetical protein
MRFMHVASCPFTKAVLSSIWALWSWFSFSISNLRPYGTEITKNESPQARKSREMRVRREIMRNESLTSPSGVMTKCMIGIDMMNRTATAATTTTINHNKHPPQSSWTITVITANLNIVCIPL